MRVFVLVFALGGCPKPSTPGTVSPTPTPTPTPTAEAKANAACPSADDPAVDFHATDDEQCMMSALFCDSGYGFNIEGCGCGCVQEAPLPPGHDLLVCKTDKDCGLSEWETPDNCCGELCGATTTYNLQTIKLLDAWHAKRCEDTVCPVAGCIQPEFSTSAVCVAGTCQTKTEKIEVPPEPQPGHY